MKRLTSAVTVAMAASLAVASAALGFGGPELAPKACGGGTQIVNVTQNITGDADSGFQGAWAFDSYTRHIRVWQTGPSTFCAILRYDGTFTAIVGAITPGQGSTSTFSTAVTGEFNGGYRSTQFTGAFAPGSTPTHGSLGTFDYACDTSFNCPGYVSWLSLYFTGVSGFDLAWWGWKYEADQEGDSNGDDQEMVWINAITGSSGDITG